MFKNIRCDIRAVLERDPAARNAAEVFFLYPGINAVIHYRFAHWLLKHKMKFLARAVSQWAKFLTGIEIHPGATIGCGLLIDHGTGVVIGETAEIGDNCTIYQGVTLGGTGKDVGKRHPTLGNNVMVGAGAKVLGPINIGNNVKIAANAVVLRDVEDDCTCVGVPGRVVKIGDKKIASVSEQLDQIHIPDPVSIELNALRERIEQLEKMTEKE